MNKSLAALNNKSQVLLDDESKELLYYLAMNIGTKLQKLRNTLDVSQEKIAEYAGVTKASVSQWEHGTSLPKLKHLLKLRENIVFSFDELLLDEKNINENELINRNQHIESVKVIDDIQKIINKIGREVKKKEAEEAKEELDKLMRNKKIKIK